MRLIDADAVKEALRSRISENIDECINNVPTADVLNKIGIEIEQLTSRYSISKERGGMGQVEWSDRLIKESDVLQIINKYREEQTDAT